MSRGEQESPGGLDPSAGVGEAGVGTDGIDDAHRRGFDAVHTFEEKIEDESDVAAAELVEADGMSVAINGGPIGQVEQALDGPGAVPVDEQLLDGLSFGMIANGAFAPVTLEIGRGRGAGDGAGLGGAKTPLDMRGSSSSHGDPPQDSDFREV